MSNWVSNGLFFDSEEDANKVWEGMQFELKSPIYDEKKNITGVKTVRDFSFNAVIPEPNTPEETEERYINHEYLNDTLTKKWFDWYEWRYENWGVKWDACNCFLEERGIYFDTTCNKPCDDIFIKIAEKFNVHFYTAHRNASGEFEEIDYHWQPNQHWEEESQWQKKMNQENHDDNN